MWEDTLCGRPIERVLEETTNFHGFPAPGVVIGAVMVDLAREQIGPGIEADAIVETLRCPPDAVQLFTACTLGNGWMRVLDWDRFALTLYDRATRRGCRGLAGCSKDSRSPCHPRLVPERVPKNALPLETLLGKSWKPAARFFPAGLVIVTDFLRRPKRRPSPFARAAGRPSTRARAIAARGVLHGKYFKMDGA